MRVENTPPTRIFPQSPSQSFHHPKSHFQPSAERFCPCPQVLSTHTPRAFRPASQIVSFHTPRSFHPTPPKPSSPSPSPTPSRPPLRRSLVSYQFMHGHYNITTPRHELIRSLVPSPPPPLSISPLFPRSFPPLVLAVFPPSPALSPPLVSAVFPSPPLSPPLFRRCFRRPALLHPPPRFQSPMRRRCRRPIPLLWNLSRPTLLFGFCLNSLWNLSRPALFVCLLSRFSPSLLGFRPISLGFLPRPHLDFVTLSPPSSLSFNHLPLSLFYIFLYFLK